MKSAAPSETSRCVRSPASRSRSSRSSPIAAPSAAANTIRSASSARRELRHATASAAASCAAVISSIPCERRASSSSSSWSREKGAPSAVACTSTSSPLAGHDDVEVDVGARVLDVVEVEQDARRRRSRRETAATESASARPRPMPVERAPGGDVGARDGRAAGAAVGLQHVAVEPERPLAERLHVRYGAQRPADQALDLNRAPLLLALARLARRPLAGRGGQHRVLRRQPALSAARHPARDALVERGGAEHPRLSRRRSSAEPFACSR